MGGLNDCPLEFVMKEDRRLQIEKEMEDGIAYNLPREYLGMSNAGHQCARYMWYSFRWCFVEGITEQHQRIFDRGHIEEPRVYNDLKRAGYAITDNQTELQGFAGHCKGHCDGIITLNSKKHVLEIKTMKQEKFKTLVKDKVKKANPGYWGQAQMYMKYTGTEHALFIVTNKNNEQRYYEIVDYDENMAKFYEERIADVISTEVPPPKIGNADWFECKWCSAMEQCQYDAPCIETCRTCQNVELRDKGVWYCSADQIELTKDKQERGCEKYNAFTSLSE